MVTGAEEGEGGGEVDTPILEDEDKDDIPPVVAVEIDVVLLDGDTLLELVELRVEETTG